MKKQREKMPLLLFATIITGILLVTWLALTAAIIIIEKSELRLYPQVLFNLWIPIVSTLVFTFLVSFAAARYYERVVITTLVVLGTIFILSSIKDTNFREIVFPVIDESLDVNLLVAGITLFAFTLALATVSMRHNSKKESPDSESTINTGAAMYRYIQYHRRDMRIERKYRKRVRKIRRGW